MTKLSWSPVKVKIGKIKPWDANPRFSTKAQAQRLIKSERELGQPQTIAIGPADNDGLFPLFDGHQRIMAWNTIKGADFEVWALQSNRPLSDDERRKISILLHTATGSWEWDKLAAWSAADLQEWGMDEDYLYNARQTVSSVSAMIDSEKNRPDDMMILDQAIQLKPTNEYVIVMCETPEDWEELKSFLKLPFVRRGGYKQGSVFDDVAIQRVITSKTLFEVIRVSSNSV